MLSWAVWNLSVDSVLRYPARESTSSILSLIKSLKALTQRSWVADSLIDTVKRGNSNASLGEFFSGCPN